MNTSPQGSLAGRVAGSALTLAGRRAVVMVLTATSTAVVARALGVAEFGLLSSALAMYMLALAATDFGFSLVLGRDLAVDAANRGRLLRTAYQVQLAWAALFGLVVAGLGVASGLGETRGQLLVLLAAGVVSSGLGAGRQVFLVLYRTRSLAAIDLTVSSVHVAATIAVVLLGGGPLAVAAVLVVTSTVNSVLVALGAQRLVGIDRPRRGDRSELLRRVLPLGTASFLSSVYLTIDLALLGWLVSADELGTYAAATKVLALLVTLPGLVMAAALPGISSSADDREAMNALAARVWHWLLATGLPLCVGAAVFAGPLVTAAFGPGYEKAVPLVQILCAAAAIALLANVLGTLLVAQGIVRPMLFQNLAVATFNVAGNVVLAPRYGVIASAWLTVATEAMVTISALFLLRGRLQLGALLAVSPRPALSVAGFAAAGLLLASWPAAALPASAGVFFALIYLLRGWPAELQLPHRRLVRS